MIFVLRNLLMILVSKVKTVQYYGNALCGYIFIKDFNLALHLFLSCVIS